VGEEGTCAGEVALDLRAQGVGAGEFLFVAKTMPEADFERTGRYFLRKIEQVAFDGEVRAVEGGTHADVCGGAIDAAVEQGFRHVDAMGGQAFLFGDEVESGENETAACAGAGANFSGEGKGAAKEACGSRHLSRADEGANGRAGDDRAANHDRRNGFDGKIELATECGENTHVAGLTMAKTEIFADEHGGGAQAVDENAADKLFGRERGEGEIEMEDKRRVEANSVETREALFEGFELRVRGFRAQDAYGMRRECNRGGERSGAARALDDGAENFLMAKVDAIEIADRQNGARIGVESCAPLRR